MKNGKVRIISISDSHLGHRKVPVDVMVDGYKSLFLKLENPFEIDYIVFGGDFFDHSLSLASPDVPVIQDFILWILLFCLKHNIKLRVLEGTPSHDRKQPMQFVVTNNALGEKRVDLEYVNTLCIKYEEEHDLHFLYVPDEIRANCEETYHDVLALLAEKDLKQVDFAFMHGNFKYQIPAISHLDCHVEKHYIDIVKHLIFIGHVHTMSVYDKIRAQGSTGRFKHGEEEDKGIFDITVREKLPNREKFVVNDKAVLFKTLDFRGKELNERLAELVPEIEKLPDGSHVRLLVPNDEMYRDAYKMLKKTFCYLHWSELVEDTKPLNAEEDIASDDFKIEAINESTLVKQVGAKLKTNGSKNIDSVLALLEECY